MIVSIAVNTFFFVFGLFIGIGLMVHDAIDKGYIVKDKSDNTYKWKNKIKKN